MKTPRAIALLLLLAAAGAACDESSTAVTEPFYPRNLLIEDEAQSGERYLHVTGMGDGSLRIFQLVDDPGLELVQKFAASDDDDGAGSRSYAFTATAGLDGAWGLALAPGGRHLYVGSLWDNELVHFEREDALSWDWADSVRDGDTLRDDIPLEADGLYGVKDVAITPDGRYLYTAGGKDGAVGVFLLRDGVPYYRGAIPGLDGAFEIQIRSSTTSTAAASGEYLLYVLGMRGTESAHTLCESIGISELTILRHRPGIFDGSIEVIQRIRGGFADELCEGGSGIERELCFIDRYSIAAMRGASDLAFTTTSSGTDVLLVPAKCTGSVVRLERTASERLVAAGSYAVAAPWAAPADGTTCGTEDDDRDGILDACDLGLTAVLARSDLVYAFSGDGGFVSVFPDDCFTTTSTTVCTASAVCIDVTDGDCTVSPGPDRLGSHPFEAILDGDVIYVTLDQESSVAILDVMPDGTPKLRTVLDAR